MVPDTVHFDQARSILKNPDCLRWTITESRPFGETSPAALPSLEARHKKIQHLKMRGSRGSFQTVYVPSLPALIRGHNAATLHGTREIRQAYEVLDRILREVSVPQSRITAYRRLDVGFQFEGDFSQYLSVLRGYKLPHAQKAPSIKEEESIRFERNGLQIEFYDKAAQLRRKRFSTHPEDRVIRCEVRFMTKAIIEKYFDDRLLQQGPLFTVLHPAVCKVFDECFPLTAPFTQPQNLYEFLALASERDRSLIDLYLLTCRNRGSRDRTKREVRKAAGQLIQGRLNLAQLIPEDRPPFPLDIYPFKTSRGKRGEAKALYDSLVRRLNLKRHKKPEVECEWGISMHPFTPLPDKDETAAPPNEQ
ncbi:hypothetical protein H5P28_11505 [Ruficoccus amylovorans]|uniref:Replication protein n=1 Tax=Ruficoccus amylovorans TaxID=1804625 RepID=A0A842HED8_9BACT|nr:hypothetical protein [Ruficoccus amylovorans]MBC2594883.1 hypothetical protein [Ruficoccus amylovorans]